MRDSRGIQWFLLFLAQILFSPLIQVLIYKYISLTQNWIQPHVGFFRMLLFMYLIPFLISIGVVVHTTIKKFEDVNKSPYKIGLSSIITLTFLSLFTIITDYTAIFTYHSLYQSYQFQLYSLELRLPFFLIVKLILTPIFSHLFSVMILSRFFVPKTFFYFFIELIGLFLYEFVAFGETNSTQSFSVYWSLANGFKLIIPNIYTYNQQNKNAQPFIFQWLPHFLLFFSSMCSGLIPVLMKSYNLKYAHSMKLQLYQKQKLKLKDTQLNVLHLDKDMLLKPKVVSKQSQLFKRNQYLYETKHKQTVHTDKLYKSFKVGSLLPSIYNKIFVTEKILDPVTKAFINYKKDVVLKTDEEERLEELQHERENELGIVKENIERLPQNGYSLESKIEAIGKKEYDYRKFRKGLQKQRKQLKKLKELDEMTNDFNHLLFHEHMFCQSNEFELAKFDQWYNSPGLDMLYQDYSWMIGLDHKHTFQLICLSQFIFLFPLLAMIEFFVFKNVELWTTFSVDGWRILFQQCNWRVILLIFAYSLVVTVRPVVQNFGITQFSVEQQLNLQITLFYFFYMMSCFFSNDMIWSTVIQLLGFTIVIFAYKRQIQCVESDMKEREVAQLICMMKSNLEPTKRMEAKKLENQLCFIYDQLGESIFRQAVQDALIQNSGKALSYLAPTYIPQRKLFDEKYTKTKVDWGGGYPRPQIEMISGKWQANTKKNPNPNPNLFALMPPDINLADLVYNKQINDFKRKRNMIVQMNKMEMQRRMLEYNQKLMKRVAIKINQPQEYNQKHSLLPSRQRSMVSSQHQMTPQQVEQQNLKLLQENIKQRMIEHANKQQVAPEKTLKDKITSVIGQRHEQYNQIAKEKQKQMNNLNHILSKVENNPNAKNVLLLNRRKEQESIIEEKQPLAGLTQTSNLFNRDKIEKQLQEYAPLMAPQKVLKKEDKPSSKVVQIPSWIQTKSQSSSKGLIQLKVDLEYNSLKDQQKRK